MKLSSLNISESDLIVYDVLRVYSKNEICLFGGRMYMSTSDDNKGDNPISGISWDQIL